MHGILNPITFNILTLNGDELTCMKYVNVVLSADKDKIYR